MIKKDFDVQVKHGIREANSDLIIIERLVDRLIRNLYTPTKEEYQFYVDEDILKSYGIKREPINWGDLSVVEVTKDRDSDRYFVLIDEAAPGACPTFSAYIQDYMSAWGWNVEVRTEW